MSKQTKTSPGGGRRWRDKDGNYCWRLRFGPRDNQTEIAVKRKTHAEREEEVAKKLKKLKDQPSKDPNDPTVAQYYATYLSTKVKPNKSRGQYRHCEQMIRLYITPAIGKIKMSKLQASHAQQVVAFIQKKELSGQTANLAVAVLCAGAGKRLGAMLREDLFLPEKSKPRDRVLSLEEIMLVIEEIYSEKELLTRPGEFVPLYRDRFIIHFLMNTGLRISEALGALAIHLRLRDEPCLNVLKQLNWFKDENGKYQWELGDLKNDSSKRIVPLNEDAVAVVRGQLAMVSQDKQKAGDGYVDHGLLFSTESGEPSSASNVYRSIMRVQKQINSRLKAEGKEPIEHFGLHDLRRSYLTHLADVEERMHLVAAIAGHANIQTTMKNYVWAQERRKSEAANKLSFGRKTG